MAADLLLATASLLGTDVITEYNPPGGDHGLSDVIELFPWDLVLSTLSTDD